MNADLPKIEVDLSGLKDIHIPLEPHWWPLPIGWWMVIGGIAFGIVVLTGFFIYWYTRPKQYALRELKSYYRQEKNPILLARNISLLLKRVALLNYPRADVATLSDENWILFLKEKTGDSFLKNQLELLAFATYMPENVLKPVDTDLLYQSARKGISSLFDEVKHEHKSGKLK